MTSSKDLYKVRLISVLERTFSSDTLCKHLSLSKKKEESSTILNSEDLVVNMDRERITYLGLQKSKL